MNDYNTIATIIEYVVDHQLEQKSLEEIAASFGISAGHLQKVFTKWVGITPKQFGRFLSLQHAKTLLEQQQTNEYTTVATGLSSSGRLHDLFVDIEAMTPGEYKNGTLPLSYSIAPTPFGYCLVASTQKGVCNVLFADTKAKVLADLEARWPQAILSEIATKHHQDIYQYLQQQKTPAKLKLHLRGTNFQIKTWEALLSIPEGNISTYSSVAATIGSAAAVRAVGTAIGNNPVGFIIPCHRVLKSTGAISGYRWGTTRKRAILLHEALRNNK